MLYLVQFLPNHSDGRMWDVLQKIIEATSERVAVEKFILTDDVQNQYVLRYLDEIGKDFGVSMELLYPKKRRHNGELVDIDFQEDEEKYSQFLESNVKIIAEDMLKYDRIMKCTNLSNQQHNIPF